MKFSINDLQLTQNICDNKVYLGYHALQGGL